ncbi:MAG: hypothetical protein GX847_05765 [Clostridiales bacterium]|nr:hypothetical protein [Clostridiales bacterium]
MHRPSENGKPNSSAGGLTYIIKIVYTENCSVQGYIRWVEEDRYVPFRSYMELLGLIEEGVKFGRPETDELRSWDFDIDKARLG